jgi:hypothetical protein
MIGNANGVLNALNLYVKWYVLGRMWVRILDSKKMIGNANGVLNALNLYVRWYVLGRIWVRILDSKKGVLVGSDRAMKEYVSVMMSREVVLDTVAGWDWSQCAGSMNSPDWCVFSMNAEWWSSRELSQWKWQGSWNSRRGGVGIVWCDGCSGRVFVVGDGAVGSVVVVGFGVVAVCIAGME